MKYEHLPYVPSVRQEYSLQNIAARCVETKEFRPEEMKNLASVEPGLRGVFAVIFDAVSINNFILVFIH